MPSSTVHPRLRGELPSRKLFDSAINGSSPLTRGTLESVESPYVIWRFIPAYAGNSLYDSNYFLTLTVHPRLRGELGIRKSVLSPGFGSSPLTRGTHAIVFNLPPLDRFIPAYAGNSERCKQASGGTSVHPRLRGELQGRQLVK